MATLSLSKDKIRILLLEGVHESAVALLRAAGYAGSTTGPRRWTARRWPRRCRACTSWASARAPS